MTTRAAAKAHGQKHYFSEKPCSQGHVGARYTSTGNCVACLQMRKTVHNSRMVGNLILEVPMPPDLAPRFRILAQRISQRDPTALLHLDLLVPPVPDVEEPVIHVDTVTGLAYEERNGRWVRYRSEP